MAIGLSAGIRFRRFGLCILTCAFGPFVSTPGPTSLEARQASEGSGPSAADSTELHDRARSAQARFERTRVRYAPLSWRTFVGACDETVGRFCLTHGAAEIDETDPLAWTPPLENEAVLEARRELLSLLADIGERIPGDAWVLGQRIAYLGEDGGAAEALDLARACDTVLPDRWWCNALEGLTLHWLAAFEQAEVAFDSALATMPDALAHEWRELDGLLPYDLQPDFRQAEGDSLRALRARAWTLADPLFLVAGNERRSEHFARHVLAMIRSEARNPYAMQWADDLTELLVRYGPEIAFERQRAPPLLLGPQPVLGRLNPSSRGMLPTAAHFRAPAEAVAGEWGSNDHAARERYAPAYAPRLEALEVHQARFRRGSTLLLVVGWTPDAESRIARESGTDGFFPEDPEAGAFFLAEPDLARIEPLEWIHPPERRGSGERWSAAARIPTGQYLVSIEVLDRPGARAWRARQGAGLDEAPRGIVTLSDLLLLEPIPAEGSEIVAEEREADGRLDGSAQLGAEGLELEDVLSRVLPSARLKERTVELAWEVYGLPAEMRSLRFGVSAVPEGDTFLARAARFLRLLPQHTRVEVAWEEGISREPDTEAGAPYFRTIALDLAALPPGLVRLRLAVELPGRTPSVSELVVELPP